MATAPTYTSGYNGFNVNMGSDRGEEKVASRMQGTTLIDPSVYSSVQVLLVAVEWGLR